MVEPILSGLSKPVKNAKAGTAASRPVPVAPRPVQVQGASLPKLVRMANDLAAMGPPVDAARIAEIRQAIATGNYPVDPQTIADAILGFDDRGAQ